MRECVPQLIYYSIYERREKTTTTAAAATVIAIYTIKFLEVFNSTYGLNLSIIVIIFRYAIRSGSSSIIKL